MLRNEIVTAVENISKSLKEANIKSVLRKGEKDIDAEVILASFLKYMKSSQSFGEPEKTVMEILDITVLNKVEFWGYIIATGKQSPPTELFEFYNKIEFAEVHLPKLVSLLKREVDKVLKGEAEKSKDEQLSTLTVVVIEEKDLSTPTRLVLMLESVQGLYEVAAEILNAESRDLCVAACDSGTDKAFDFLGLAKIMDCVKEVILSFWDRVIYFRENKTEKQLELICKSLPIFEQIATLKKSKKLEPERAELLKRQVTDSINKFASAGVTIPEIEKFTVFKPRELMRPERKLLVEPKYYDREKVDAKPNQARIPKVDDPEFEKYMEKMAADFLEKRKSQEKGKENGSSNEA